MYGLKGAVMPKKAKKSARESVRPGEDLAEWIPRNPSIPRRLIRHLAAERGKKLPHAQMVYAVGAWCFAFRLSPAQRDAALADFGHWVQTGELRETGNMDTPDSRFDRMDQAGRKRFLADLDAIRKDVEGLPRGG